MDGRQQDSQRQRAEGLAEGDGIDRLRQAVHAAVDAFFDAWGGPIAPPPEKRQRPQRRPVAVPTAEARARAARTWRRLGLKK